jgi:hypothetical protein
VASHEHGRLTDAADELEEGMNIYQRVHKVMQAVAYVRKDKQVENYMAVTHDMVTAVVRPHFVEAGIVISPRVVSGVMLDTGRKSKSGNPAMRYEGTFEVDFINMDEPADKITIRLDAHADDYGDKAPGKAISYATKYAVLKLLMLETGENEEGRITPDPPPLSADAVTVLESLRAKALEGTKPLEEAWKSAGRSLRVELADHLDSLKEAAAKADGTPTKVPA